MKRLIILIALLLTTVATAPADRPGPPHGFGISFGVFYSSLHPYGEWISVSGGMYAWRPHHVARSWRPYYYGSWSWTSDGWYWVSDEPWAWAVYHYGRWYFDDYYGWIWIPGYDWAPAWVEWRYSTAVIGWAPLGPYAIFDARLGISYHRRWVTPYHYWSFVGIGYLGAPGIYHHVYHERENQRYVGVTRSTGEIRYDRDRIINRGPDRAYVEERTGKRLREADLVRVGERTEERILRGKDRDEIRAYRLPEGERGPSAGTERPARVLETERRPGLDLRNSDLGYRLRTMGDRDQVTQPSRRPEATRPEVPIERLRPSEEPRRVAPPPAQGPEVRTPPARAPEEVRRESRLAAPPRLGAKKETPRGEATPERSRLELRRESPRSGGSEPVRKVR